MHVADTPERLAARRWLRRQGVFVLYEDNHVLGVAKAAGLLSQGGPAGAVSLPDLVGAYRQRAEGKPRAGYVGLVHRLDRNVSGAMVIAKTSKAAGRLAAAFRDQDPLLEKVYYAWVARLPDKAQGRLVHRLRRDRGVTRLAAEGDDDAREARLLYTVAARGRFAARLRIELETGFTHQIRAQLSHIGHPLVGDEKYGGPSAKRPALHAYSLTVPHPTQGTPLTVGAPIPEDLVRIDARYQMDPPVEA